MTPSDNFSEYMNRNGVPPDDDGKPCDSFELMAMQCLLAAIPASDRAPDRIDRAIILVRIPSGDWATDVFTACNTFWPHAKVVHFDGSRSRRADVDKLMRHHVRGGAVVVISESPETAVPKVLLQSVSHRYDVEPPDKRTFLAVARKVLRGDPRKAFSGVDVTRLDFADMCMALVSGDTAQEAAAKVKARLSETPPPDDVSVPRLDQMQGYGEARSWAQSFVADVKKYRAGEVSWKSLDQGFLLFGPPGTGKSLFARVVANEAGIPFVHGSIASYFADSDGHLGGVIKAQRKLFAEATACAPCVLFLDELDALPGRDVKSANNDFWRPVITDLLLLLDSPMSTREGVFVVGATNRMGDLDPALVRPGRMDRLLYVPPPGPQGLADILRHYLGDELRGEDLTALTLSRPRATGADVVAWVKSARRAARNAGRDLLMSDLREVILGKDHRPPADIRHVAVHEIGHVVVAMALGIAVTSVTIARGDGTHGQTSIVFDPIAVANRAHLEAEVMVMLGGRAAEMELLSGEVTVGAGGSPDSDLARATHKIASIHTTQGMGKTLVYREDPMDDAIRDIVEADLQRLLGAATDLITKHRDIAWRLVNELIVHTTLNGERLAELFGPVPEPEIGSETR